jgi:hypothetical protein
MLSRVERGQREYQRFLSEFARTDGLDRLNHAPRALKHCVAKPDQPAIGMSGWRSLAQGLR